jgi:crossover junction endodeoxyribonuclease RusA
VAARAEGGVKTIIVPGKPVPKQRPRVVNGRAFTPAETREAEKRIAWVARAAGWTPLDGRLAVALEFVCASNVRGDLDNLAKLALDALNGIAWRDDKQVVRLSASVEVGAAPLTRITVAPLAATEAA